MSYSSILMRMLKWGRCAWLTWGQAGLCSEKGFSKLLKLIESYYKIALFYSLICQWLRKKENTHVDCISWMWLCTMFYPMQSSDCKLSHRKLTSVIMHCLVNIGNSWILLLSFFQVLFFLKMLLMAQFCCSCAKRHLTKWMLNLVLCLYSIVFRVKHSLTSTRDFPYELN